jgi:ABC-type protease/lipase transport system fused ATPase/permease subunit
MKVTSATRRSMRRHLVAAIVVVCGIVVVIAHRPSAIAGVDLVLVLKQGRMQAFGPKDEILSKVLQRDAPAPRPLKVVSDIGGSASS